MTFPVDIAGSYQIINIFDPNDMLQYSYFLENQFTPTIFICNRTPKATAITEMIGHHVDYMVCLTSHKELILTPLLQFPQRYKEYI